MKKSNFKTKFLMILLIFTIFLPNAQVICFYTANTTNLEDIKPKSAAARLDIGAWIIVAGDRESDHACVTQIKKGSDLAYFILASRDVDQNDIKYLGPDPTTTDVYYTSIFQDDIATLTNIEDAITNWAASRVGPGQALGMYLFDHGGTNGMAIPGPNLADTALNGWLDDLETSTGCNRMVIIYEACSAGSFINPISKHNRIVITSTDTTHSAYASADWAYFSEAFFSSIVDCKTIGECFEDAVAHVKACGYYHKYKPMIDDNHDETGHLVDIGGNLPNGGDGSDALNYWIGDGYNCPPETLIFKWPLVAFVKIQAASTPVWAVVDNHTTIDKVYVRVIPPDWVPPDPPDPDDDGAQMVLDPLLHQSLTDPDGDGNYTGLLYLDRYRNYFGDTGEYNLTFHVKNSDGSMADVEKTSIVLNDDGTIPPDTTPPDISITNPDNNVGLSGIVNITAEGDDDQALDKILIYLDGTLLKEESMPDYYPYPEVKYSLDTSDYSFGLHNITARAVDKASNVQETTILVNFEEDRIPGFQVVYLFTGAFLGIVILITLNIKRKSSRRK